MTHARHTTPANLLAVSFLTALGTGVFAFALPLMSLDERVGGAWLGSAFGLYFLARLLAAPLGGMWADRAGPFFPLLFACTVGAGAPLLVLTASGMAAPNTGTLHLVQLLLGLAGGMVRPAVLAGLAEAATERSRPLWFARHALLFNAAVFLAPLLGGLLYLGRDMSLVLLGLGACMTLGAASLMLAALRPASAAATSGSESDNSHAPHGPAAIRLSAPLPPLLLAIAGRTLGIGALTAFYPLHLAQTLTRNSLLVALVFAAGSLATCTALPFAGRLLGGRFATGRVATTNHATATALGMLLSALALMLLGRPLPIWQFVLGAVVMGLGAALSTPASMTLAAEHSQERGKTFGLAQVATGLGLMTGPILGGLAVRWTHETGAALELCALLGMLLTLPLLGQALQRLPGWSRSYSALAAICALACLGLLLTFSSLLPVGQEENDTTYRYTDTAMGTIVRLSLDAPNRQQADRAARATMDRIRRLQRDLDHRNPEGSIGRINSRAGAGFATPTPFALALIQRSLRFAAETGGRFDPTVGAVTAIPFYFALDPSLAESKAGLIDYRKVRIENGAVMLPLAGMALDLGGMAKGTIIDEAVKTLQELGVPAGLVEAGGDFRCYGERDWTVGIQNPRDPDDEVESATDAEQVMSTLHVRNVALCGSGDYRRFVLLGQGGRQARRHHIIDPRTLHSAQKSIAVTAMAPTAERADALATTLFILGPEQGLAFLREQGRRQEPGIAAQWILPDLTPVSSPGFPED